MARSSLFHISPEGLTANPVKFPREVREIWGSGLSEVPLEEDKVLSVSSIFIDSEMLDYAKVGMYLDHKYTIMIEKLFRHIMEQNPTVELMEWHFKYWTPDPPYCFCIKREDMEKQYAVQMVEGHTQSVHYYDPPKDDEEYGTFNKKRYLATFPKHMNPPKQLVDPRGTMRDRMLETLMKKAPGALDPIIFGAGETSYWKKTRHE